MSLRFLYLVLCVLVSTKYINGSSNSSGEHLIRKALLDDYDKAVLPTDGPGHVNVIFGLKIKKLIKVDNKEQLLTIDTWIVMKWNNSFLSWDKSLYKGINRVQFSPTEIWFPDVALYNNGDDETPRAGGPDKFLSNVQVKDTGLCVWSGPATFKVSCEMKLKTYPFDRQTCVLRFGSFSYANNQLRLKVFKTKKSRADRFLQSGDWDLGNLVISTGETDHGNCCPYKFSEITFSVEMSRLYKYHMFYLVAPCAMLAILALISFWIPSESGERIGFVTTLLLGMMVFLLIIPASLPESSKAIPVLGILMMATMIMISSVLVVTILILKCFHSKRNPPSYFKRKFGRTKSYRKVLKPDGAGGGVDNINLRAVLPSQDKEPRSPIVDAFTSKQEADNEATWQSISRIFDKVMFCVFLILTIVLYAGSLTFRD